jgi:ectoine hydroxylase-related dioxygenase (phytanoyl-CoA dioxygenase family)
MTTTLAATATGVEEVLQLLERDGYAIVTGILDADEVAAIRAELRAILESVPKGRNAFEGYNTRRIYALFAKTRLLDGPATHPLVLGVLDQVLGNYQLSAPTGIEIGPGEAAQVLHHDDAIYPLPRPHDQVVVTCMWPFDDFTTENGATRLIPGSHTRTEGRPDEADVVIAEMPAGSVMFYLGTLWHGGGANRTDRPRLGVVLEYVASWLRAQENHFLAVPREVVAQLPERLQELLGYNVYPPFVGYVDGRHPRRVLEGDDDMSDDDMSPSSSG